MSEHTEQDNNTAFPDYGQVVELTYLNVEQSKCPICLSNILNRSLTDICGHEYCFDCINQWSTCYNLCPVCRQVYRNIIYVKFDGEESREIPIQDMIVNETQMNRDLHFVRLNQIGLRIEAVIQELNQCINGLEVARSQITRVDNILRELSINSKILEDRQKSLKLEIENSWLCLLFCCFTNKFDKLVQEMEVVSDQIYLNIISIQKEKQKLETKCQIFVTKIGEIAKELQRLRQIINHLNQSFILD